MIHQLQINNTDWQKWRLVWEGGRRFVTQYLKKYSARETTDDFDYRSALTYDPGTAKDAVIDVVNSVSSRLKDVVRIGGSSEFHNWVETNCDSYRNSLDSYLRAEIVPELVCMGLVGVLTDAPALATNRTKADSKGIMPFITTFRAEDILGFIYGDDGKLDRLHVSARVTRTNQLGFPSDMEVEQRLYLREASAVSVYKVDNDSNITLIATLDMPEIPFTILAIRESLLADVADMQITLLNLASSDISFTMRCNFPIYTEQFNAQARRTRLMKVTDEAGNEVQPDASPENLGNARFYPKDTERPGWINPSSEPLKASMEKQNKIEQEIEDKVRQKIKGLTKTNVEEPTVESGLAAIGDQLERLEREIALYFKAFTRLEVPEINYPEDYSLKTTKDVYEEVKVCLDAAPRIPSLTAQKVLMKRAAKLLAGRSASAQEIVDMMGQIDDAKVIVIDPKVLDDDIRNGLVDMATASKARLYPDGVVEIAKAEHLERLKAIAMAQSAANTKGIVNQAARGTDPHVGDAVGEKTGSQTPDLQADKHKAVRK